MTDTIEILALAVACFVGGHFMLSSLPVRRILVRLLGELGFRAIYSAVALAALIWVIAAYRAAPREVLWVAGAGLRQLPVFLMPIACILAVAGLSTRNVTLAGGEALADSPDVVSGIITVTRHPFLWAVVLWSAGHLVANGDAASVTLFAGMGLLALGGMAHIDHRRHVALGALWGPIAMTTSVIPFLAAIQGRVQIDWRGIGWLRPIGGIVLFIALATAHGWFTGVELLPGFLSEMQR